MRHPHRTRRPAGSEHSSDDHAPSSRAVTPPVANPTSRGDRLPHDAQAFLEAGFEHRFDSVNVHDNEDADARAKAIGADAFTIGSDIFFARGVLTPESPRAQHILAHEAAHVIQNESLPAMSALGAELGAVNDAAEIAAERAAQSLLAGNAVDVSSLEQSGGGSGSGGVVRRWPSLDWLGGAASSIMGAGAGILGGVPGALASGASSAGSWFGSSLGSAAAGGASAGAAGAAGATTTAGSAAAGAAGGAAAAAAGGAAGAAAGTVSSAAGAAAGAAAAGGAAAGAAGGPAAATKPDAKMVASSVASLNKAMAGWGTDEGAIYATLKGKSPAEIAAIKEQYKATTGTSLDEALKDEMSGAELKEAQAYLSGDPAKGAAAALANAAAGWGTDEAKIMSTIKQMDPAQYLKVRKEFAEQTGQSLDDMLKDELSGGELKDAQKELTAKFSTGLGKGVDTLTQKSPTLTSNINTLADRGWVVEIGEKGKGTFASRDEKRIVVDPDETANTSAVVQSLAHESGHAMYTMDAYTAPGDLSKEDYVKKNTMRHLKDEGEATITNMIIRNEILGAKGGDIGVAGAKAEEYKKLYESFKDPTGKDRDKLREAIGKVFAKGETPSTDATSNYEDYYGKDYAKWYDENVAKKKD